MRVSRRKVIPIILNKTHMLQLIHKPLRMSVHKNPRFPIKTCIWFTTSSLFIIGYGMFATTGFWRVAIIWAGITLLAPVFAKLWLGGNKDDY